MKRPSSSDLVLENGEVKLRLKAERLESSSLIHVDWVRFTVPTRFAPVPTVETLFPTFDPAIFSDGGPLDTRTEHERDEGKRMALYHRVKLVNMLREFEDQDYAAHTQAFQLAEDVADILGPGFIASSEVCKGKDFYRFRFNIERYGQPVGWVGFLSTSSGKRADAQSKTIHCSLEGKACTFARPGWRTVLADYIDEHRGLITRCDLALDFFDGVTGGFTRFPVEYQAGLMDHMGHRPQHDTGGSIYCDARSPNKGRSFYFGSRAAGKITNIYEKGIQLFGPKDASDWLRIELRYGNQKRLLPSDMLRRPDDFFSGASNWHALMLAEAGALATPEPVKTEPRLPEQTILAECVRNARWVIATAGKSLALAFKHMDFDTLLQFIENCGEMPNRLSKFSKAEVERFYAQAFKQVSASGTGRAGLQAA